MWLEIRKQDQPLTMMPLRDPRLSLAVARRSTERMNRLEADTRRHSARIDKIEKGLAALVLAQKAPAQPRPEPPKKLPPQLARPEPAHHPLNYSNLKKWTEMEMERCEGEDDDDGADE